ncbi:MAG: hypothetical protein EZS28_006924, partial [Streblomastix strix]
PETYYREEIDEILDKELNICDQIDAYSKTEDDALLLLKADKSELIDAYSKIEADELLALKLNISDQIDAYNKTEADALIDDKLNISDQIEVHSKIEADALLLLKADKSELIDAYSKTEDDELLASKLNDSDQIDAYSKTEADALLDDKLNISDQIDAYNKTEADALLLLKADKTELIDAYSKTEADALLDEKLNITDQIDAYIKGEDDALLLLKADKTELVDYVDLTSTQTITGQKQFNSNVSAATFAKTGKNNVSILLAGDGDMLVSTFVSQSQLQEVRDIASGKSKGYVFATTDEMNTWMEDQETLRALETELPDMSNVMTILGTATGGGNAIIDLSFDGNTLIPAKNSSFITTNFDETITGQKTFNTTIHSVGISVQNCDNNSVVCAGDGVKSIQDISASVDFSNYYNKSQTYSKTEADALFDDKLNVGDQIYAYNKGEDDALLLLKANQSTTYTKTETDYLIQQIEVGDVDLSGYMTLVTSQTITTNKTFNNACRFISSIDGMATITIASFVKS